MNEVLFELGKLTQGQKDIETAVREGFAGVHTALNKHVESDDDMFEKHAGRLTKLEHTNIRIGVYSGLIAMVFSAVCAAAARAFFG